MYNFLSVILIVAFVGLSIASTAGSTSLVALLVNTQFQTMLKLDLFNG